MELRDFLADSLQGSIGFMKMTIADLSDADLRERPVPAANSANWQLGHLTVALTQLFAFAQVDFPPLPDSFASYRGKPVEGAPLLSKDELLATLDRYTGIVAAWARTLTAEQLAMQTPEKLRPIAPTLAHLLAVVPNHNAMHVGQIQVLRRKLGKPILF